MSWAWQPLPAAQGGGASITGTFGVTIDAVTQSTNGDLLIQGTAAQTIAAVTLTSDSDLLIKGNAAQTIAAVTLTSDSDLLIQGTFNQTIDPVTLSANGSGVLAAISATFGVTIDPVTLTALSSSQPTLVEVNWPFIRNLRNPRKRLTKKEKDEIVKEAKKELLEVVILGPATVKEVATEAIEAVAPTIPEKDWNAIYQRIEASARRAILRKQEEEDEEDAVLLLLH